MNPHCENEPPCRVLLVDDNIGDIAWLIDYIKNRTGCMVHHVTNEEAARRRLDEVKSGKFSYTLTIIDIMVSIRDVMDLVKLDDEFYEQSRNTGIRLCRYVRENLKLSKEELPIVCLSARDDEEVRKALDELGIRLFSRTPQTPEDSIRNYLEENLPKIDQP